MQCTIENRGLFMENNIKEESRLKFQFAENDTVIKFDDTKFYRNFIETTLTNCQRQKVLILFLLLKIRSHL